jgi:hypothetical protein
MGISDSPKACFPGRSVIGIYFKDHILTTSLVLLSWRKTSSVGRGSCGWTVRMWVPVQRPVLIRHDGSCPLLTGAVGGSWQLLRIPHLKPKPLAALSFQTQARYPILPAQELCFDLVSLPGCSWVCGQPQLTVDRTTWTSVQEAPARAPPQDPKDEDEQDVEKTKG